MGQKEKLVGKSKHEEKFIEILKSLGFPHGSITERALFTLEQCISVSRPKNILEFGFYNGGSAAAWLLCSDANVVSCDNYSAIDSGMHPPLVTAAKLNEIFNNRLEFLMLDTQELHANSQNPGNQRFYEIAKTRTFDLIYIDAGHSPRELLNDIALAIQLKIPYILIDDYFDWVVNRLKSTVEDEYIKTGRLELLNFWEYNGVNTAGEIGTNYFGFLKNQET